MYNVNKSKLQSIIPVYWASIIDISVTAFHQSPEYWNGNLALANEANPIGAYLMQSHVYGLFIISGIWLLVIGALGFYLPKVLSKIFLLSVLISHTYAACTWINPRYGLLVVLILVIINASIYIINEQISLSKYKIEK